MNISLSFSKKMIPSYLCAILMLTGCQTEEKKEQQEKKEQLSSTELKQLSETMGHYLVENLYSQKMKLNLDSLIQGIRDAEAGQTPPLDKQKFLQELTRYREIVLKEAAKENLDSADEFLKKNKTEEGIVILEDGKLQYLILKEGSGPEVKKDGTPILHYEGKLLDGKVFESTETRGKAVPMPLSATFPGFKEGVAGMKQGEKRRIFIHPDLGFGSAGPLPPNSLLIFEVTVEESEKKEDKIENSQDDQKKSEQENNETQEHKEESSWVDTLKEKFL